MVRTNNKIIFVAPRMHTNEYGISQFFLEKGFDLEFHVNTIGKTEIHKHIKPTLFKASIISSMIKFFFGNGRGDLGFLFPSFFKYFKKVKNKKPFLVFIKNPMRVFSIYAIIIFRIKGCKIILYSQSSFHSWSKFKWFFAKLLVHSTDSIWISPILNSDQEYPVRFHYLPFVVENDFPNKALSTNKFKLMMIGKYKSDRKNHKLFIDLIYLLSRKYNIHADIIGETECVDSRKKLKALQDYSKSLGTENLISFHENIPFTDIKKYYSSNHIYILPSSNEPAAISILEAMSFGLISFCSDTCGTKVYLERFFPDLIFKSDSLSDLRDKIEPLLESKSLLKLYKKLTLECKSQFNKSQYDSKLNSLIYRYWKMSLD